jgi:hypothetical protein
MIYSLHRWKSLLPTLCSFVFRKEGERGGQSQSKEVREESPSLWQECSGLLPGGFPNNHLGIHRTQTESKSEEFPEEEELESLSLGSRS